MKISKKLYVTNLKDWRKWLKNHSEENEIWLVYYKKASGKARIPYNDAVDEALCYGWIDSTVKKIDEESFAQRFTPRRQKSVLSDMNRERIIRLIKSKRMRKPGLDAVKHVFDPNNIDETVKIPKDVLKALKKDKKVWKNFQEFPDYYKRIRLGYIVSQRKHSEEMFKKALNNFIKMTKKNKRYGMVQ